QNELVGFRTSGTSLTRLAMPVFVLGLLFSIICWFLAGDLSPMAKRNTRALLDQAFEQDPVSLLEPNAVQTKLPGQRAFITSKDGETLKGLHLYQLSAEERDADPELYVYARSVDLEVDYQDKLFMLSFEDAFIERLENQNDAPEIITASTAEPWPIPFPSSTKRTLKPSYRGTANLIDTINKENDPKIRNGLLTEFQKRNSLSLACLAFAFIGVPLGINARRRETTSGLVLSLLVAAAYFGSLLLAENFEDNPLLCSLMMWLPNILAVLLGIILIRRASHR
ncbi:MAG: LptF/LptG family permease, partial [Verrucomicrobiota bacterium]